MSESTPTPPAPSSAASTSWGSVSRGFCLFGGVLAFLGGMQLAGLKAEGANSLLEAIANGLGLYCMGKGVFMIAISLNLRAAIAALRER